MIYVDLKLDHFLANSISTLDTITEAAHENKSSRANSIEDLDHTNNNNNNNNNNNKNNINKNNKIKDALKVPGLQKPLNGILKKPNCTPEPSPKILSYQLSSPDWSETIFKSPEKNLKRMKTNSFKEVQKIKLAPKTKLKLETNDQQSYISQSNEFISESPHINSINDDQNEFTNIPVHTNFISPEEAAHEKGITNISHRPGNVAIPYAVSVVDSQEVQDIHNFNNLQKNFDFKKNCLLNPSLVISPQNSFRYSINPKLVNNQKNQKEDTPDFSPKWSKTQKKNKNILTRSNELSKSDEITISEIDNDSITSRNMSETISPTSIKRFFISPLTKRKSKSPKRPDDGNTLQLTGLASCFPYMKFQKSKSKSELSLLKNEKSTKNKFMNQFSKEDIHVIPNNSQFFPQDSFANHNFNFIPVNNQGMNPSIHNNILEQDAVRSDESDQSIIITGNTSSIDDNVSANSPFIENGRRYDKDQIDFSNNRNSSLIQKTILTTTPEDSMYYDSDASSQKKEFNMKYPSIPQTEYGEVPSPNPSHVKLSSKVRKNSPFHNPREVISPAKKNVCRQNADQNKLNKYQSKSEMNLRGIGVAPVNHNFMLESNQKYFRNQKYGGHSRCASISHYSAKPEIPPFPPNSSNDEVKRSIGNINNARDPQYANGWNINGINTNLLPKQYKAKSYYENIEYCYDNGKTEAVSTNDLLESQAKPTVGYKYSKQTNHNGSEVYMTMNFDANLSEEIGFAVTSYRRMIMENSKLLRSLDEQYQKQSFQAYDFSTVNWSTIEMCPVENSPFSLAFETQDKRKFSLWAKTPNFDDYKRRSFKSLHFVCNTIPRHFNVIRLHSYLKDIPIEIRDTNEILKYSESAYILDLCNQGTLEDYLKETRSLLESNPEKYEHNIVMFLIQILNATSHLFRNKAVHRDMNMSDILISPQTKPYELTATYDDIPHIILSDFTYTLRRSGAPRAQPFVYKFEELDWLGGDENKLPPEIIHTDPEASELNYSGADSFAIGCMIYEMLNQPNPFGADAYIAAKPYVIKELPAIRKISKYSDILQRISHSFLNFSLHRRLDMSYASLILQMVMFGGEQLIDDEEISEKKIRAFINDRQVKFLHKIVEKSSLTLLNSTPLELSIKERIELHFLAQSQPFNCFRAIKNLQIIK